MAYIGDKRTCLVCGAEYREMYSDGSCVSSGCPSCAETEAEKKKREHFKKLDAMTTEERIRRIEEVLYNRQIAPKRSSHFPKY